MAWSLPSCYAFNADAGTVANDIQLTVTAVPEPGSAMLLGGAALVLGWSRRRRRDAAAQPF